MSTTERYYGLDALRGIMMMLGIVLHAATYHLLEVGVSGSTDFSIPIITLLAVIHQFRMPLFFVLAGFFTALLVQRYTMPGMYRNRVQRILYPFLLALVTIVPLTNLVFFSIPVSLGQGSLTMVSSMEQINGLVAVSEGMPRFMSFMHLWFLYYLLFFYLAVPLLERLVSHWFDGNADNRMLAFFLNPWSILVFSVITMVTLLPFANGAVAVNDPPFGVSPAPLLYYFVFFASGYFFYHARDILQTFRKHTVKFGIIAVLCFLVYGGSSAMAMSGNTSLTVKGVATVFAAISTWSFIYFFTGLFLNRYNRNTAISRFLSQGAYWIYLVHMPLVLFFGVAMMNMPWPPLVTFTLNSVITAAVCAVSYMLFVRGTWLGKLLNGRRYNRDGNVIQLESDKVTLGHGSTTAG